MSDPTEPLIKPVLGPTAQALGSLVGIAMLAAGAAAVFETDNGTGSTALITAGLVILALATFANRIAAFEGGGIRLELAHQAQRAQEQAVKERQAGNTEKAIELEGRARGLIELAASVGARYEKARAGERRGWDRTSRLESVLREGRALDVNAATVDDVARLFFSGTEGNRVVALALVQQNPQLGSASVLVDAITHSRTAFEEYHALVATEKSLDFLSAADRDTVVAAVKAAYDSRLADSSSDRRTVARRILEI